MVVKYADLAKMSEADLIAKHDSFEGSNARLFTVELELAFFENNLEALTMVSSRRVTSSRGESPDRDHATNDNRHRRNDIGASSGGSLATAVLEKTPRRPLVGGVVGVNYTRALLPICGRLE